MLETPYLLFLGDAPDGLAAKVAQGVKDWRPEHSLGQYRLRGCQADMGLPDLDIDSAVKQGAKTLIVGVANRGGVISENWLGVFSEALEKGMDIASGLHNLLGDIPELVSLAEKHGRKLIDVRVPTVEYPLPMVADEPASVVLPSALTVQLAKCTQRSRWKNACVNASLPQLSAPPDKRAF